MDDLRVLLCRADPSDPAVDSVVPALDDLDVHRVGPRPGKDIDPLLTDRILVVGDDADLAAVVLRLLRRDLLRRVVVSYATTAPTPVTGLYSLPIGAQAVRLARIGEPDVVPLVRDDVGGVLVGRGQLAPVDGTVYLDEHRIMKGSARGLIVHPFPEKGLEAAIIPNRLFGVGRRPHQHLGRAVQIGTVEATVVSDGVPHPRKVTRWTFYKHTEPLRLVRGALE